MTVSWLAGEMGVLGIKQTKSLAFKELDFWRRNRHLSTHRAGQPVL